MKTHIVWLAVVISALLIGTQLGKPSVQVVEKPVEVVRTKEVFVEKPVEVIKEVPKEIVKFVERKVEVPAEIPELYTTALDFMEKFRGSKLVSQKDALTDIDSVSVEITLSDDIKKLISESEIRTKFEITLRRSGIPINEKSRYSLVYYQDGFTGNNPTLIYTFSTSLEELVVGFRDGLPKIRRYVATWRRGNFGTVGISKARDTLLADAESAAEGFANEWLAMNPKK